MKKKIIVYGIGSGYRKREKNIEKMYDVVAYTDSNVQVCDKSKKIIIPCDMEHISYDFILVCSVKFFSTIKYLLVNDYHIDSSKIIDVSRIAIDDESSKSAESIVFSHVDEYQKKSENSVFKICKENMWLLCNDYYKEAGTPHKHYFAQDIWGARKIYLANPSKHYDVGSRVDGFLAHLLTFRDEVNYIDIRPLPYQVSGLHFTQSDATNLENIETESIESLSSFHAIEHFGLGRYGDPIDPEGSFKALSAFQRVLKPNGKLYLGVPIGPENKLIFNAHRIFNPQTIVVHLDKMKLEEFAIVVGDSACADDIELSDFEETCRTVPEYSCGLFVFTKK